MNGNMFCLRYKVLLLESRFFYFNSWQLTCELIRKMQRDVQLPLQPKSGRHLVSRQPAREQLHAAWSAAVTRGWLDHTSARTIHCLVDTAGSSWLVSAVLSELLQSK